MISGPGLWSVPPSEVTEGPRAADLASLAGLDLDDWQRWVLEQGLGRSAGKWAAFEVALIVARQNGKGSILEALELAALFLFDDVRLILHSAHEFKTAAEAFLRVRSLIDGRPEFERRVSRVRTAAGAEAIELRNGKRLRFVARSSGRGGFTADLRDPGRGAQSSATRRWRPSAPEPSRVRSRIRRSVASGGGGGPDRFRSGQGRVRERGPDWAGPVAERSSAVVRR